METPRRTFPGHVAVGTAEIAWDGQLPRLEQAAAAGTAPRRREGNQVELTLDTEATVSAGQALDVTFVI